MKPEVIKLHNVWKIFGKQAKEAIISIQRNQLDKTKVLEQFDCVVSVENVNLSIKQGEVFCIMGLSGSGKSTLVRHINRLLEPTAGENLIHGKNVMKKIIL